EWGKPARVAALASAPRNPAPLHASPGRPSSVCLPIPDRLLVQSPRAQRLFGARKSILPKDLFMNHTTTKSTAPASAARLGFLAALAMLAVLAVPARAQVKLKQLSKDTFTNSSTQHATEVEPDTYSFGSMFVTAFQVGRRYANGGSSDIGFATSTNGGSSWKNGFLPGLTIYKGGKFDTVSDPSVVYDAHHGVWLISSLGINDSQGNTILLVSSSADGINWNKPVTANSNSQ